jgi:hypothetical protein
MAAANTTPRGVNNNAFSVNPDKLAQLVGSGGPVPGSISPTYAATVVLDSILNYANYVRIIGVNATSATCSISTTNIALAGALLSVSCESSATGTCTYTFGAGFKSSGTAAATTLTAMTVNFRSNGTNYIEVSRSLAITY